MSRTSAGRSAATASHRSPNATSVETSLEDFGADVDHRDRDSRRDRPEASEFGVDDRPEVEQTSEGDQSTLFADTAEDQQTLAGDDAADRCLFEE